MLSRFEGRLGTGFKFLPIKSQSFEKVRSMTSFVSRHIHLVRLMLVTRTSHMMVCTFLQGRLKAVPLGLYQVS